MSIGFTVIWCIVLGLIAIIGLTNGCPMVAIPMAILIVLFIVLCVLKQKKLKAAKADKEAKEE